jgi:tRNA dimethylallyltransferase
MTMEGKPERRAVLIAGPTASGKSAMALRLAAERGGVIINTDAMQVYSGLRVLTARPSLEDTARADHRLYGFVDPVVRFSTGHWARSVADLLATTGEADLIFVGGTGLYFDALVNGFTDVPHIPAAAALEAEDEIAGLDRAGRAALIARRDPAIATRLETADPQRVARALAVLNHTGRSLASFQDQPSRPLLEGFAVEKHVLNPHREVLRERIAERFRAMFSNGAIEEVDALLARELDPSLPAMKAIGVPQIAAWRRGKITPAEAMEQSIIATHQYAKRQRTWFRGRMADWEWHDPRGGT